MLAFLFADLIVLPIIAIYRKYYGTAYALRIVALMFVTMVIAALIDAAFSGLNLIPSGRRPSRDDIFGTISLNYRLVLNVLGVVVFAALFWLTARRGATDPVCGMKVDLGQGPPQTGRRRDVLLLLRALPARLPN